MGTEKISYSLQIWQDAWLIHTEAWTNTLFPPDMSFPPSHAFSIQVTKAKSPQTMSSKQQPGCSWQRNPLSVPSDDFNSSNLFSYFKSHNFLFFIRATQIIYKFIHFLYQYHFLHSLLAPLNNSKHFLRSPEPNNELYFYGWKKGLNIFSSPNVVGIRQSCNFLVSSYIDSFLSIIWLTPIAFANNRSSSATVSEGKTSV